jgi:uncharacterized membrane protein YciS (DUF1049 family)
MVVGFMALGPVPSDFVQSTLLAIASIAGIYVAWLIGIKAAIVE